MTQLEPFINKHTTSTPFIQLEQGKFFIIGRSILNDPVDFYKPMREWIADYAKNYKGKTKIVIGFDHISTATVKVIYDIFRDFTQVVDIERKTSVEWYCESNDDDLNDLGKIFQALFPTDFKIIEVESIDKDFIHEMLASK